MHNIVLHGEIVTTAFESIP